MVAVGETVFKFKSMKIFGILLISLYQFVTAIWANEEKLPFLLCDFSAGDMCNWQPKAADDMATWEADWSRDQAYAAVGFRQHRNTVDRQAIMKTNRLWPSGGVACLKIRMRLLSDGDQLQVILINNLDEQEVIYETTIPTTGEWRDIDIPFFPVGWYHLAFNGTISENNLGLVGTVAVTNIQVYPFACEDAEKALENLEKNTRKAKAGGKKTPKTVVNTANEVYTGGLWPDKIIPYYILADTNKTKSFSFQEVIRVRAAIDNLNSILPHCIQFVPVAFNSTPDFLYIIHDYSRECWSDGIGRLGGIQAVRLNWECLDSRGAIQSILLNAIGLYHEHDRPDREKYLDIHPENIVYWAQQYFVIPPFNSSYNKFPSPNAAATWGLPYDPTSLTHFSETKYSFEYVQLVDC